MNPEIDGARILERAREIAFPRYPGTDGDRRAIEIVAHGLQEAGMEVAIERFSYDIRPAFRILRTVLIVAGVLVGTAGAVAPYSPSAALALIVAGLIAGGTLLVWAPGAERIYARPGPTETANVVGYRRVASPAARLIVMAHHDSKSQNLSFPVRMGLTLLAILGGLGLAVWLVAGVVGGGLSGPTWVSPALGGLVAACLFGLSTLRSDNRSPGGVDNAGSVGILLELAHVLPARIGADVELVFLCTGAEEDHMIGAMRWLEAHHEELEDLPVNVLNFDGAGAPGRTVLLERYGFGKAFSPTLSRIARECARRLRERVRGIVMLPAMGIDAIPFAHHGIECLTFASGSLDRATTAVHSANDVAEHLDPDTLERVAVLARDVAVRVTEKV